METNQDEKPVTEASPIQSQLVKNNLFSQKRNILFALLAVFIVFILGILVGYFLLSGNILRKIPTSIKQPVLTPTPDTQRQSKTIEPINEIDTKDWKEYKNKDFTIKFPKDVRMKNSNTWDWYGFKNALSFYLEQMALTAEDKDFYGIRFTVVKNTPQTNVEGILKLDVDRRGDNVPIVEKNVFVYKNNNLEGLFYFDPGEMVDGKPFGKENEVLIGEHATVIAINNRVALIFDIHGGNYGLSDKQFRIFDQILSTFTINQLIKEDKPLSQQINFTIPEGWRLENQDKNTAHRASGAMVIKSNDWDDNNPPNFMETERPGLFVSIWKDYGGILYTREDEYKSMSDEIKNNPGDPGIHDLTKLTIAGNPAISSYYTFEACSHAYQIWQDDNIWNIDITCWNEQSFTKQINDFLSSITFN